MKKSDLYVCIGSVTMSIGAYLIHYGLAIMIAGVAFLIGGFFEYNKERIGGSNE